MRADLPFAQKSDRQVATKLLVQQLRDEVQVGHKCRLKDDGHVGCVEQLDWVRALCASPLSTSYWQIYSETLQNKKSSLNGVHLSRSLHTWVFKIG